MGFTADKNKWTEYVDLIGDDNPIHRDDGAAISVGLDGVIAPGMWVASHVQGDQRIREAEFGFKSPAYGGDVINEQDGSFYREGDLICRGNVVLGDPTGDVVSLPEGIAYSQDFSASERDIRAFLNSVGSRSTRLDSEMRLMASSAQVLLGYAKTKNLVGMHASQSVKIHRPFSLDCVRVVVEAEKIGRRMCKMNLYWVCRGEVVATGKSRVIPLSV